MNFRFVSQGERSEERARESVCAFESKRKKQAKKVMQDNKEKRNEGFSVEIKNFNFQLSLFQRKNPNLMECYHAILMILL